jgi:lipoyl-dependent peroxiredoxin
VSLTTPEELGGLGGDGANPEKLFAAGYAACFLGAMKFVASQGGPKVPSDATVTATVGIGPREGFGLPIAFSIASPGVPPGEVEALVAKARQVCPYSNATRNDIDVKLTVNRARRPKPRPAKAAITIGRVSQFGRAETEASSTYWQNSYYLLAGVRTELRKPFRRSTTISRKT